MNKRLRPTIVGALIVCLFLTAAWWLIKRDIDTLVLPPDAVLPDGSRYYGELADGKFHGRGRLIWPNGSRHEGEFENGLASGQGESLYPNGDLYKGEFRLGQASGRGRLVTVSGTVYEGMFANDMPNGHGVYRMADGATYEGEFVNWEFHGQGAYTDNAGATYTGNFVKGSFTGTGTYRDAHGNVHEGRFLDWKPHGAGVYTTSDGATYRGRFEHGQLDGKGTHATADGDRYEGEFRNWHYDGRGTHTDKNGNRYTGEFRHGQFHGKGEMVYAEPRGKKQAGKWRYGQFQDPQEETRRTRLNDAVERALYRQDELLQNAWRDLLPSDKSKINLYFVGVAGDGRQDVFLKEVRYIRELFDNRFGAAGRSIVLINHPETMEHTAMATRIGLERTLHAVAAKMNPDKDILFLYLTSHGSNDHRLTIANRGLSLPDLSAQELAAMLRKLPVKWKVIAVSACYSGGFIPPIRDDDTLIMTSASSTRTSFGCSDTSEMTYFGKALFKEALPEARSFQQAFAAAEKLIHEWEAAEISTKDEHSLPKIFVGRRIAPHLEKWWRQLRG
jgi:hypothetical protein